MPSVGHQMYEMWLCNDSTTCITLQWEGAASTHRSSAVLSHLGDGSIWGLISFKGLVHGVR